jgi:hypothetical protein
MMKPPQMLTLLWLSSSTAVVAEDNSAELLFVHRIAPLMQEKCLACHGADEKNIKSGLDLRNPAGLLKGGDSKKTAVVAGQPEQSPIYLAVTREHTESWEPMPPKQADKLSAEQIGWIKTWISGGAPWPDEECVKEITKANAEKWVAEDGVTVKTSGGLSAPWTNRRYKPEGLWAYQPVRKPAVPWGSAATNDPIDAFITAKMPAGLHAAMATDRTTLIRRATFDLTGLPPRPEEVEAFIKDKQPDTMAFAKVVERLLASPHYGERMAQHWLDVVRYAD